MLTAGMEDNEKIGEIFRLEQRLGGFGGVEMR